jgi:hypothetical protein
MTNITENPKRVQEIYVAGARKLMLERTVVEAPLFDLPAKMVMGNLSSIHALPDIVKTITERVSPEELGTRLRSLGVQVGLGPQGIGWMYIIGRLQRYLNAGWPDREPTFDDHAEAAVVLSFYERLMRSYRSDGKVGPDEEGAEAGWPTLSEADVMDVESRARERGAPRDPHSVRRSLAQLESFIWIVHADARDGIWHHGPYPLSDGSILVFKELTDLQPDYLPWARDAGLSVSRVVVALILSDVDCAVDMVGGLHISDGDYLQHCAGIEILAGDALEPIDEERLAEIAAETKSRQKRLFVQMMSWDDDLKVSHGATQYANDLRGVFELAGFSPEEIQRELIEPFEAAGAAYTESLKNGEYVPTVFGYLGGETPPRVPDVNA